VSEILTALEPVEGKSTVRVRVGQVSWEIGREAADALGLAPGLPVDAALVGAIEAAADRRVAAARVLRHLRNRPRTEREVRDFLLRHSHGAPAIDAVLNELRAKGLVDDGRYASWYVTASRGRKPAGSGRIVRELLRRGVPRDMAARAAEDPQGAPQAELERAMRAARPRFAAAARLGRERGLRRLHGFLLRRGFAPSVARQACLRLFAPAASEPDPGE
jgi:regulatory protein